MTKLFISVIFKGRPKRITLHLCFKLRCPNVIVMEKNKNWSKVNKYLYVKKCYVLYFPHCALDGAIISGNLYLLAFCPTIGCSINWDTTFSTSEYVIVHLLCDSWAISWSRSRGFFIILISLGNKISSLSPNNRPWTVRNLVLTAVSSPTGCLMLQSHELFKPLVEGLWCFFLNLFMFLPDSRFSNQYIHCMQNACLRVLIRFH